MENDIYNQIENVKDIFPFKDYIDISKNSHFNICLNVLTHLSENSTILDLGCGPLDNLAIIKMFGHKCYGIDDHKDPWHLKDDNKEKIYNFAKQMEIPLFVSIDKLKEKHPELKFDMIILNDIIEHFHNSPRFLLNDVNNMLKDNGLILITTPNSLNLIKRIKVIMGKTNYGSFKDFFYHDGTIFRGHVREYSYECLKSLSNYMNYEIIKLQGCHQMLDKIPKYLVNFWKIFTKIFPNFCDSFILIVKKREFK